MSRLKAAAVALPVLLLLAGSGCSRHGSDSKAGEAGTTANTTVLVNAGDVVVAGTRALEAGISFSGELVPQEVTEVVARFDGDLDDVLAREGQQVRQGQPLARYKPRDINDAWQAAEADLLSAQAALAAARNGEDRARKLLEAGAASPSDLETATTARSAAEARVRAAEAASNHARENADKLDVPAPISGGVSEVLVHSGDRTAVGDRLFTLVNTDVMELSATLPSEALSRIRPGTPIRFHLDAFPGEVLRGEVDRINPTTEPGTRQIRVYTRIPNPDHRLVGGLYAGGRVVVETRENAVAAPVGVLRTEGSEQVVYRLHGGSAERVPVRMGLVDEEAGLAELIGSVAPGDSLLTGVIPGLRDGVGLRILQSNNHRDSGAGR